MAQPREKGGRVVFIGNIPYGVSEEQICEIFGRCGQVVNFRLVYDKETGRPKGFGFLEYTNVDEAASAVRNLNEHEIMGRTLRVDYSNENSGAPKTQNQGRGQQDHAAAFGTNMGGGQANGSAELPPMPPGTDVPPGLTAPDAISKTLSQLPPPQLLDMISQMKTLVMSEPQKATALLSTMPQLSYAIFQALLLLGLVDTNVLGTLIQTTAAPPQPPPQPQPPQQLQPPPPMPYQQQTPQAYPQQPYGQPPAPYTAPQYPVYNQPAAYNPTPPVGQPAYQPPAPQPQPQPPQPSQDQAALIQQLMSMTREQIFAQDEATRNTILQLRAQYGAPVS